MGGGVGLVGCCCCLVCLLVDVWMCCVMLLVRILVRVWCVLVNFFRLMLIVWLFWLCVIICKVFISCFGSCISVILLNGRRLVCWVRLMLSWWFVGLLSRIVNLVIWVVVVILLCCFIFLIWCLGVIVLVFLFIFWLVCWLLFMVGVLSFMFIRGLMCSMFIMLCVMLRLLFGCWLFVRMIRVFCCCFLMFLLMMLVILVMFVSLLRLLCVWICLLRCLVNVIGGLVWIMFRDCCLCIFCWCSELMFLGWMNML